MDILCLGLNLEHTTFKTHFFHYQMKTYKQHLNVKKNVVTVALTNTRIISRVPQTRGCCSQGPHFDKTVFLKDVGILTESTGCLSCQCYCSSWGDKPKPLGFYGGYGYEFGQAVAAKSH